MTKRVVPALLGAGACLALASPVFAQQRLTVATYGGNWGEAQKACILDPFAKASGVQVVQETSVSTVTYNKLKQQKGNPSIDIAWIDGGISELAGADGVVAPIDPAKVPNISGLINEAVYKNKDGKIYALSTGFYALGIAYNSKELKEAPQSWWDLWKPEYAGKVTLPSPVNAAGIPFFAHVIGLTGGTLDNSAAAVDKLKAIKVSSYYDASGVAQAALQSGEAIAAAYYNTAAWAIADKGLPDRIRRAQGRRAIRRHPRAHRRWHKKPRCCATVRQLHRERRGDELPGGEALRRPSDEAVQDFRAGQVAHALGCQRQRQKSCDPRLGRHQCEAPGAHRSLEPPGGRKVADRAANAPAEMRAT